MTKSPSEVETVTPLAERVARHIQTKFAGEPTVLADEIKQLLATPQN